MRYGTAVVASFLSAVLWITASPATAGQRALDTRVVLAAVRDADGQPYVNLGPDDFVIEEKGEGREVLSVYVADYPIVLMVDDGSHAGPDLRLLTEAASDFVRRIGDRPVVLVTLANPPAVVGSFDDGRPAVLKRLEELTLKPTTVLRPVEAAALAANAVQETGAPFGAIVVVAARPVNATQPESTGLLKTIFSSGLTIHAVGRTVAPTGRTDRALLEGDLVRHLAEQTGGQFTTVFSAASYSAALEQIAQRLASELMVQYLVPPGSSAGADVRVGVTVPGVRVRGLGVSR